MSSIGLGSHGLRRRCGRAALPPRARELGLTPSAVAKSVARLEADLGVRLLHRTTREVSPRATAASSRSAAAAWSTRSTRCAATPKGARGARGDAAPDRAHHRSASGCSCRRSLRWWRAIHAAVDLALSDRYADLVKEGPDAAVVRVGVMRDFVVRRAPIALQQLVLVASPAYSRSTAGLRRRAARRAPLPAFACPPRGASARGEFARATARWSPATPGRDRDERRGSHRGGGALRRGHRPGPGLHGGGRPASGALVEIIKAHRPPALPISIVYAGGRLRHPAPARAGRRPRPPGPGRR